MERPLDTIRSFQAAAEGTSHSRRSTYSGRPRMAACILPRAEADLNTESQFGFNNGDQNRRSSYYGGKHALAQTHLAIRLRHGLAPGGYNGPQSRPRPGAGGYYRNQGFRPDSFVEEAPGASQQWPARNGVMRNASAPVNYPIAANGEGASPTHSHQQSYETMTSGSDENSKSTNPSSQNSSFDQLHMLRKPGMGEEHGQYDGQNGYNGNFSSVSPARGYGPYGGAPQNYGNYGHQPQQQGGPMPPPKPAAPNNPRVPIKLGGSPGTQEDFEADFKRSASKRKSWFSRKFSKSER